MWTSLSASRWICVFAVAVVLLFSAIQVDSYMPIVGQSCCCNVSSRQIRDRIKTCYEQRPRGGCNNHAFLITTRRNKQWCIDPAATWLQAKIEAGKLVCPVDSEVHKA